MTPADAEFIFNGVPAILALHENLAAMLNTAWDAFPDMHIGKASATPERATPNQRHPPRLSPIDAVQGESGVTLSCAHNLHTPCVQVFKEIAPYLRLYTVFVNKFDIMLEMLASARRVSKSARRLVLLSRSPEIDPFVSPHTTGPCASTAGRQAARGLARHGPTGGRCGPGIKIGVIDDPNPGLC